MNSVNQSMFGSALLETNNIVLPDAGGLTSHVTVKSIDITSASAVVDLGSGRGPITPKYGLTVKEAGNAFHLIR